MELTRILYFTPGLSKHATIGSSSRSDSTVDLPDLDLQAVRGDVPFRGVLCSTDLWREVVGCFGLAIRGEPVPRGAAALVTGRVSAFECRVVLVGDTVLARSGVGESTNIEIDQLVFSDDLDCIARRRCSAESVNSMRDADEEGLSTPRGRSASFRSPQRPHSFVHICKNILCSRCATLAYTPSPDPPVKTSREFGLPPSRYAGGRRRFSVEHLRL